MSDTKLIEYDKDNPKRFISEEIKLELKNRKIDGFQFRVINGELKNITFPSKKFNSISKNDLLKDLKKNLSSISFNLVDDFNTVWKDYVKHPITGNLKQIDYYLPELILDIDYVVERNYDIESMNPLLDNKLMRFISFNEMVYDSTQYVSPELGTLDITEMIEYKEKNDQLVAVEVFLYYEDNENKITTENDKTKADHLFRSSLGFIISSKELYLEHCGINATSEQIKRDLKDFCENELKRYIEGDFYNIRFIDKRKEVKETDEHAFTSALIEKGILTPSILENNSNKDVYEIAKQLKDEILNLYFDLYHKFIFDRVN